MESPYPKIKNAILLCLLFIVFQALVGIPIGILGAVFNLQNTEYFQSITALVGMIIPFSIVIILGINKTKNRIQDVFHFKKIKLSTWIITVLFSIGLVIVSSEIDNYVNFFIPKPEFMKNIFASMMPKNSFILSFITIALIPGITEELLFRGLILEGFKKNYSIGKAILLSALLFGLIHLNPWQFITAFFIGLFSAWMAIKTESLFPSIFIHIFNNGIFAITSHYPHLNPISGFNNNGQVIKFQPIWFTCIGLALFIVSIYFFIITTKKVKHAII